MGEDEDDLKVIIPKHIRAKRRKNKISVVIAACLPLLLILYVIYMNWLPFGYSKTYTLQVGAIGDNDSGNDIYISKWQGSAQLSNGVEPYRVLDGEAQINFKPKIDMAKAKVYVSINFTGNETLYIKNNGTWEVYWNPAWDKYTLLYSYKVSDKDIEYLHDPANLRKGDVVEIKANPLYYSGNSTEKPATLRDWLAKNENESLYFYNLGFKNYENDELEYNPGPTVINTTLRGTHKFYVYLNDSLNLTVWKKDLNAYNGRDDMNITLYLLNGTQVYNEMFYDDDDGNISVLDIRNKSILKQIDTVQIQNFYTKGLKEGVYALELDVIKGYNNAIDSHIEELLINTNKIVSFQQLLPVAKTTLYTENNENREILLYYWNNDKEQDVIVNGDENKILSLTKEDRSEQMPFNLKGNNTLTFPKGYVVITGDMFFAFSKENYFEPFEYDFSPQNSKYLINKNIDYCIHATKAIIIKSEFITINKIKANIIK